MSLGPLNFDPFLRPRVWGGRRLESMFGKSLPDEQPYGESWEISGHEHHVSRVLDGPHAGESLTEICQRHGRDVYGAAVPDDGKFPLLVKLLDCNELLSIQVHPSDLVAAELLGDERGKTEAWIILDVQPEGRIYAGLKKGVDRPELERHLDAGTMDQCLHAYRPRVGDCLFIPAGTVHAVGGGVVMAEVQQSSAATFRLFDWNRTGLDGKPRTLHRHEALASIDFDRGPVGPTTETALVDLPAGVTRESLVRCPYFWLDRLAVMDSLHIERSDRMTIWMILAGSARLLAEDFEQVLNAGTTVMLPACVDRFQWICTDSSQSVSLLRICLPD